MRLINVETFQLCEIQRPDYKHPYVILSHTWGDDEVTFQEFSKETGRENFSKDALKENARYSKIVRCCAKAELRGFKYVWIDTCCIDKTSSSELSEAINSMYQWYKEASVCYAYLSDVDSDKGVPDMESFKRSRWFTRGWTLQELTAPKYVAFFDRDWSDIGTKLSLRREISDSTGVPIELLVDPRDALLHSFCIAQRMSWAANRQTTRVEDTAYCLMGIFDVNMPILYGEGEKAFIRLQEEILKRSDDQSLFAWTSPGSPISDPKDFQELLQRASEPDKLPPTMLLRQLSSVLAQSPANFRYGRFVECIKATESQASPWSFTNKGLHISLPLIQTNKTVDLKYVDLNRDGRVEICDSRAVLAVLACKSIDEESPLAIILLRQSSGRYIRFDNFLCSSSRELVQNGSELPFLPGPTELYIETSLPPSRYRPFVNKVPDPSLELITIDCTVVECGHAYYRGRDPGRVVALTIKSRGMGLGNAMVVLSNAYDADKISCWVFQPPGSASFRQTLQGWYVQEVQYRGNLDSIGTDRAALELPNGDRITVSVNIGADPPFVVVVQWAAHQSTQPRIRPRHLVSEQQVQDRREMQRKCTKHLGDYYIFNQEISRLPQAKYHDVGKLEVFFQ